jgi:hypothetical protein
MLKIIVANVNHPPSFNVSTSQLFLYENTGLALVPIVQNISAGPGEDGRQNVSILVEFIIGDSLFAAPPRVTVVNRSGILSLDLVNGSYGAARLSLRARDDGGVLRGGYATSSSTFLNVTVQPLNSPPSFELPAPSIFVSHDAGRVSFPGFASKISAGPPPDYCSGAPPPCVPQSVVFTVDHIDRPDLFARFPAIDPNGTLSFTPLPAATGTAVVRIHAEDTGAPWPPGANTTEQVSFTVQIQEAPGDAGYLDFILGRNLSCLTLAARTSCTCPPLTAPQASLPACSAAAAGSAEVSVLAPLSGSLRVDTAAFAVGKTAAQGFLPAGLAVFTAGPGGRPWRFQELRQDALRAARGAEYARDAASSSDGRFGYAVDFETDALLAFNASGPSSFTALDRRVGGERRLRFTGFGIGPGAPFNLNPVSVAAPATSDWRGFVAASGDAYLAAGAGYVPRWRTLPPAVVLSSLRALNFSHLWGSTTALWTFDLERCSCCTVVSSTSTCMVTLLRHLAQMA